MMNNRNETAKHSQLSGGVNLRHSFKVWFTVLVIGFAGLVPFGCATSPTNTNAGMNSNASLNSNTTANTNTNTVGSAAFATREPDQYSLTMTITGQGTANNKQGTLQPQAIEFSRMGSDRRWSLTLPLVGQ